MRKHVISFAQVIKILLNIKLKGGLTPPTHCVRLWVDKTYGRFNIDFESCELCFCSQLCKEIVLQIRPRIILQ